ncbi:TonB-dependent siderophore receptor [Acetobacter persici]|uniref:TonB-dependent siderophore receptor n=1 Tax=Acetobacter persici TaxID=1076596 RepID=UPI001BA750CC|nr:TonB-dependent siderophore receptor [Acetobacter persici]MBS1001258.1 TonB-dependent siderophore receptor [Acetobacter persici]
MGAKSGDARMRKYIGNSKVFLLTSALGGIAVSPLHAQTTAAKEFHIPAQSLPAALTQFGRQAGLQVSIPASLVEGKTSHAVNGTMSPSQSLAQILSGTGLTYRVNASVVTLVPATANITLGPVRVGGQISKQDPTGPGVGFVATTTMASTKTDTPITEIPNSIYVVTKQIMQDQQPQNVQQALRYTPGVFAETFGTAGNGAAKGPSNGIMQRGFATTEFIDGLMTTSSSAGETAFVERIEAVNGPASVMYGQVAPGGMLSIDLKKPTDTPLHSVSLGFGNWGRYEATFDISDKLTDSGNVRYRIAAIGVTQGSQTNYIDYHRVGVLPSITWDIDRKTSLTLLGMYMYTPGDGISTEYPISGTLISNGQTRISRSAFLGLPGWNTAGNKDPMFEYQFKHKFNKYINFSQVFRWENSQYNMKTSYLNTGTSTGQSNVTSWTPWLFNTNQTTSSLDTRLFGKFKTGPVSHTWVIGNDFRNFNYPQYFQYDLGSSNFINSYNPQASYSNLSSCFSFSSKSCFTFGDRQALSYFQDGLYFQDQIKWKGLSVLLGGRQDWVNYSRKSVINYNIYGTKMSTNNDAGSEPQSAFTWRAGLIYNFDFGLAPYFSYSTSFVPQAGSTNYLGQPFAPLTGKQFEAGLKYKFPHKDILLTASAFHIDEDHYLISDLTHSGFSADAGRVVSQGFEVSANANITRDLRLVASYSYTDIRFGKSNVTDQRYNPYTKSYYGNALSEEGMSAPQVPRNMFSIFADYTMPQNVAKGFGLNWGLRYVGSTYVDNVESFKTPSYVLFDLGAHYDFGAVSSSLRGLKAQIAVSNLTNKYYLTACSTSVCYLGQGRRVYGNLTYNW